MAARVGLDHEPPTGCRAGLHVAGAVWIALTLLDHEPERLTFPVLFTVTGIFWFGRATLRVQEHELLVPNRVWGGRRVTADEVGAIEVPDSVWSTRASWVVLTSGERLVLRGADHDRARRIATELGVEVHRLDES